MADGERPAKHVKIADFFSAASAAGFSRVEGHCEDGTKLVAFVDPSHHQQQPKAPAPLHATKVCAVKSTKFTEAIARGMFPPTPMMNIAFKTMLNEVLLGEADHEAMYAASNSPMAGKSAALRREIAAKVVRQYVEVYQSEHANVRSSLNAEYDFEVLDFPDGVDNPLKTTRVLVVNARMTYDQKAQRWSVSFQVDKNLFDTVYLVFEGCDDLMLFDSVCADDADDGGPITIHGHYGLTNPRLAHSALACKMRERYQYMQTFAWNQDEYSPHFATPKQVNDVYKTVPLGTLSDTVLDNVLENVVCNVLRNHFKRRVETSLEGEEPKFLVNDVSTVNVSSRMSWNTTKKCYELTFNDINSSQFTALYVTFLTPSGIHIFNATTMRLGGRHPYEKSGLTDAQMITNTMHSINMTAPAGCNHHEAAESFFVKNFTSAAGMNLPYVARVWFGFQTDLKAVNDILKNDCHNNYENNVSIDSDDDGSDSESASDSDDDGSDSDEDEDGIPQADPDSDEEEQNNFPVRNVGDCDR